jgi:hypothetical protein
MVEEQEEERGSLCKPRGFCPSESDLNTDTIEGELLEP